uniref:Uncharacterized protein n=1 Tax=Steinernema glaseri TaxID=37863 RepID=A0A1I7ZUT8_9BILA
MTTLAVLAKTPSLKHIYTDFKRHVYWQLQANTFYPSDLCHPPLINMDVVDNILRKNDTIVGCHFNRPFRIALFWSRREAGWDQFMCTVFHFVIVVSVYFRVGIHIAKAESSSRSGKGVFPRKAVVFSGVTRSHSVQHAIGKPRVGREPTNYAARPSHPLATPLVIHSDSRVTAPVFSRDDLRLPDVAEENLISTFGTPSSPAKFIAAAFPHSRSPK